MTHYHTLGIPRSASLDEIKHAYRQLALKFHPDRNPYNENSEKEFKQILAAYEVLSDSLRKSKYDATLPMESRVNSESNAQKKNTAPPPAEEPVQTNTPSGVDDLECTYFGNESTGRHIQAHLYLTKSKLRDGGRHTVSVKKRGTCRRCLGDGTSHSLCPKCNGKGREPYGNLPCMTCDGPGYLVITCTTCNGIGCDKWISHPVTFHIPPNSEPGHTVTLVGEGEVAAKRQPGNLRVVLLEKIT